MPLIGRHDDSDRAADPFLRVMRRIQVVVCIAYAYDALILFGFSFAGFVDARVPIMFVVVSACQFGLVAFAHESGWSRHLAEPTIFLPQQLSAIAMALLITLLAPQIGFQPFATLFAICAFSFMAPNTRSLLVCWAAAAAGMVAVIFVLGPRLEMPTSTLAGQALTGCVMIGVLIRCVWLATFFRRLQKRLVERNAALKTAIERIEVMANRDELTGLPNRRSITASLHQKIDAARDTGTPLSIALLDIDHFKRINDFHGHHTGDRTLQIFAGVVSGSIRATDRLGRYGGEEFLMVLAGATLDEANETLERIRARVAAHEWGELGANFRVTVTVGVARHAPGETAEALVRRADMALYLGKEGGRDRVVVVHDLVGASMTNAA